MGIRRGRQQLHSSTLSDRVGFQFYLRLCSPNPDSTSNLILARDWFVGRTLPSVTQLLHGIVDVQGGPCLNQGQGGLESVGRTGGWFQNRRNPVTMRRPDGHVWMLGSTQDAHSMRV